MLLLCLAVGMFACFCCPGQLLGEIQALFTEEYVA